MGEASTSGRAVLERPERLGRRARPGRHGPLPAEAPKRRRVLIADERHNGTHLRTTWHPERGMFVVSTWSGDVCLGAIRVPVVDAAELMSLLMDGLVETIEADPVPALPAPSTPRSPIARRWDAFRARVEMWARTSARTAAAVRNLRVTTEPPPSRRRPRRTA